MMIYQIIRINKHGEDRCNIFHESDQEFENKSYRLETIFKENSCKILIFLTNMDKYRQIE